MPSSSAVLAVVILGTHDGVIVTDTPALHMTAPRVPAVPSAP